MLIDKKHKWIQIHSQNLNYNKENMKYCIYIKIYNYMEMN